MRDLHGDLTWTALPNPFLNIIDTFDVGHVSGRIEDIVEIITGGQSAIILMGAPGIGKTALIRYLQLPPDAQWSWRDELAAFRDQLNLDEIHFVPLDLTALKDSDQPGTELDVFLKECVSAIDAVYQRHTRQPSVTGSDLRELRKLLRAIKSETPNARYFVVLDAIDRLVAPDTQARNTPQDMGLALLDRCKAIRTLVDLIDEFNIFGVILSVESLPRPDSGHQFSHVSPNLSADLARFRTMPLQVFTWEDAGAFLAQEPENFGADWARRFKELGGQCIFSSAEQRWLLEQAGTHPYLLQQFCFETFRFKNARQDWSELQDWDKRQLVEKITESLSTFLANMWKRLEEAIQRGSSETESSFRGFIELLAQHAYAEEIFDPTNWERLGPELRYILYSEGILRRFEVASKPVHYPGVILSQYLFQQTKTGGESQNTQPQASSSPPGRGFWLTITQPGNLPERLPLSEREYHLLRVLIQHPQSCKETELMVGAWGKVIERPTFTQRMHHLRKKLKERFRDVEFIENQYGGLYSLHHPEWFWLEP